MPSEKAIERYFAKAKVAAQNSTYPRQSIGAVLVFGGKIIATGYNTNKTSPFQKKYNQYRFSRDCRNNGTLHAETMLLLKTKYLDIDWGKASVYVYRAWKDGTLALAKPCPACQVALEERGITHVYYTTPNGYERL